jgi:hypothetical protein
MDKAMPACLWKFRYEIVSSTQIIQAVPILRRFQGQGVHKLVLDCSREWAQEGYEPSN